MKQGFFYGRLDPDRILHYHGIRSIIGRDVHSYELIDGHHPYGIHRYARLQREPFRYVTMLRDPLEQAISYYYFVRNTKTVDFEHPAYCDAIRFDIADFYSLSRHRNLQTRYLAGVEWKRLGDFVSYPGSAVLRAPKRNLNRYTCFGIQERFNDSVDVFSRALDLSFSRPEELHKKTPGRPLRADIGAEAEARIREANAMDYALYLEALERFHKQEHYKAQ